MIKKSNYKYGELILKLSLKLIYIFYRDTAGQERFHSITKSFYRHAKGILLVYDVTNSSSFDNISKWLRNVKEVWENFKILFLLIFFNSSLPMKMF